MIGDKAGLVVPNSLNFGLSVKPLVSLVKSE